jgi:hypothetical protein
MTFAQQLQRRALLSLLAMDERPMPEDALIDAIRLEIRPRPTLSDAQLAVQHLERLKLVQGVTDPIMGVTYTLTTAGAHKAREIQ